MFQGFGYNVDYVFCVDGSERMREHLADFKEYVSRFRNEMITVMEEEEDKELTCLRAKVIVFRDFAAEGKPMEESRFFTLFGGEKEENDDFLAFVNGIEAVGGSDRSNGYEALALAMKSKWTREGPCRRHVIQLFTNAPAIPLKEREFYPGYPEDMPADFSELWELWAGMNMERRAKRMHIFAPDHPSWHEFLTWENTIWSPFEISLYDPDDEWISCKNLLFSGI